MEKRVGLPCEVDRRRVSGAECLFFPYSHRPIFIPGHCDICRVSTKDSMTGKNDNISLKTVTRLDWVSAKHPIKNIEFSLRIPSGKSNMVLQTWGAPYCDCISSLFLMQTPGSLMRSRLYSSIVLVKQVFYSLFFLFIRNCVSVCAFSIGLSCMNTKVNKTRDWNIFFVSKCTFKKLKLGWFTVLC